MNLREMARIKTPIIIVVIGEGYSGGALGMGVGDVIGMLEHACYSVISPEGCASILWKDASKKIRSLRSFKNDIRRSFRTKGLWTKSSKNHLGGAHHDPKVVYQRGKRIFPGRVASFKTPSPRCVTRGTVFEVPKNRPRSLIENPFFPNIP